MQRINLWDYESNMVYLVDGRELSKEEILKEIKYVCKNMIGKIVESDVINKFKDSYSEEEILEAFRGHIESVKKYGISELLDMYGDKIMNVVFIRLGVKLFHDDKEIFININKIGCDE